jgi:acetate kinase
VKVLVLNCGSSSIKYQLNDATAGEVLAWGIVSRIGEKTGQLDYKAGEFRWSREESVPGHGRGVELILDALLDCETGVLTQASEVSAVGHRVVHGGSFFNAPARLTPEAIVKIEACVPLAPLHNPAALVGIRESLRILPSTPQVAVFDTAFHAGIPAHAYTYALPQAYSRDYGVRRYGFHGISFQYVASRAQALLGGTLADTRIVIAHLGNGASVTAVNSGRSVDTSMGMTPLEGLVMGTRSGDLDPGIVIFMMQQLGLSNLDVDRVLNRESGLLGISGLSNDMRDVLQGARAGGERCRLALDVYCYRLKKYIGAYAAAMGGLNALVFTGGVGENGAPIRARVCEGLSFLGIELDEESNSRVLGVEGDIGRAGSGVRVLVVPTDEEKLIAKETMALLGSHPVRSDGRSKPRP